MHVGRYTEALQVFEEIIGDNIEQDSHDAGRDVDIADATIKAKALNLMVQVTGLSTQSRQSHLAIQALAKATEGLSESEILVQCEIAIRLDALLGDAWF